MKFLEIVKNIAKSNSIIMDYLNTKEVNNYCKVFYSPDFKLVKLNPSHYKLVFDNKFGYKLDKYSPEFCYDAKTHEWITRINNHTLRSRSNPCFQLVNELRGYTLLGNPQAGYTVIDVGASDGFISQYFSHCVGKKGRVIAIEPDPSSTILESSNITLITACLSKRSGKVKLNLDTFGASRIGNSGVDVESISLPDVLNKAKLTKIDYIKLDIEGEEVNIIHDLVDQVLANPRLIVAIASYHKIKGVESWIILEQIVGKTNKVIAKTLYPYHATTFLVNQVNKRTLSKLNTLPSYQDIYHKVWPHGE